MRMNELELAQARIAALQAAIDKLCDGNKSAFGRRLGYKDGAFVRQMISGERPVTEKTIRAIEAIPGMRGWFSNAGIKEATATPLSDEHKGGVTDAANSELKPNLIPRSGLHARSTMEKNTEAGPKIRGTYPLISWAQAGTWESIVDNFSTTDAEEWLDSPVSASEKSYYLKVRGESMFDPADHKSFREGELVLVDPRSNAVHGSFVIIQVGDDPEPILRQLIIEADHRYLKALNPAWPGRIVELNGNAVICGTVKTKIVRY
jgi:SOS-response transcriptional repressor LexA